MTDLEEDGLAVAADGAAHVLGAGQRGVAGDVLEHLRELAGAVVHHVPVHAVVVGNLLQAVVPAEHFFKFPTTSENSETPTNGIQSKLQSEYLYTSSSFQPVHTDTASVYS